MSKLPTADPDKENIFKMKITAMRRPDGQNQYKITIPKDIVERVRKDNAIMLGEVNLDKNHVLIRVNSYVGGKTKRR